MNLLTNRQLRSDKRNRINSRKPCPERFFDRFVPTKIVPVTEGNYEIRVSERAWEKRYSPWSIASSITWREEGEKNKKPVNGVYFITPIKLSSDSPQATLQAQSNVNIEVQFSDKKSDDLRECNVDIHGRQNGDRYFAARPGSDSPSAYRGDGLFTFQVPIGLKKATLRVLSDGKISYRAKIDGEQNWINADNGMDFNLETIEKAMKIEVAVYQSPRITLDVVDETGKPVKEYYAWIEYADTATPAKIKFEGDKIRVDITPERWHEINWDMATSELSFNGILDVSFKYKDFGKSETKINAAGLLPDKEMRLYIIGKGCDIQSQLISGMKEGEEKNLNVVLKKPN